ncbi:MAG TPA: hypothetical protein VIK55_07305 [Paludibacter sp.]
MLYSTLLSILKIIIFSRLFSQTSQLKTNGHLECYILGNGPSLKENILNDLELLKSKDLFVVNDFAKSRYFEILKPKFYVLLDPCYWSKIAYKEISDNCTSVLNTINDKTEWPIFLIVPIDAYKTNKFQNIFKGNINITIVNYNSTPINGFQWFNFFIFKNNLGIPTVNNVLGACIYIAINMQYNEINILGADHSWTKDLVVNDKNQVCFEDSHFYDETNHNSMPIRDMYGEYYTMHQLIRDFALMFEGYHILKKYSKFMNVNIYNRSKISFIDAFERKDLVNSN